MYLLYNTPRESRRLESAVRGAFVLSGVQHVTSLLGQWAMGDLDVARRYKKPIPRRFERLILQPFSLLLCKCARGRMEGC